MPALPQRPLPPLDLAHVCRYAEKDLESLKGARLFVTGGTGFFGKWLVTTFLHANREFNLQARISVLTRDPERFRSECPHLSSDPSLQTCQGDVRTFQFPAGSFSHVIHGAVASGGRSLEIFDTILDGSRRTLEFAARSGVQRFLFLSSGAVYGPQPPEMTNIPESYRGGPDTLHPGSAYAEGKRAAEHLACISASANGFDVVIARCFAFAGPYLPLHANYAIGNFVGDVLEGRPITVQGDGTPYRSYLFTADLAVWLWATLCRGRTGTAYNVGSDAAVSIADLARTVADVAGGNWDVRIAKPPQLGVQAQRYVPSIDRARSELGLEVRIDLKEGIKSMLEWHRAGEVQ